MASASFQLRVNSGSYAAAGVAVDAVEGDVITAKLVSVGGINGSFISWTIFGTHGGAAPALTSGGAPSGQEVSFTVPSGLSPAGGAYGLQCDINGGVSVTSKSANTAKSAVYVLNASGLRPFFYGETIESDASYGTVPRLNAATNPATVSSTSVTTTPYTVLGADRLLLVNTASTAKTVNLPAAADSTNRIIAIKDASGNASANNITVDGSGSETIDGAATFVISADYDSIAVYSNGTEWFLV